MAGVTAHYSIGVADTVGGRKNQQDHFIVTDVDGSDRPFGEIESLIVAVADGVGGEAAGEVASQLSVTNFAQSIQQSGHGNRVSTLEDALHAANDALEQSIRENPDQKGMASTLVGAILKDREMHWVSVGDSNLYLVRNGQISRLNADHSLGALLDRDAQAGNITHEEAQNAAGRNRLISYLAGEKIHSVDLKTEPFELQAGDRLVFSSDGLNTLALDTIGKVCADAGDAQACAEQLVTGVLAAKKRNQDNTMVVVVEIAPDDAVTDADDEPATMQINPRSEEPATRQISMEDYTRSAQMQFSEEPKRRKAPPLWFLYLMLFAVSLLVFWFLLKK